MKAINIIGIAASVILFSIAWYYRAWCLELYEDMWTNLWSYDSIYDWGPTRNDVSAEGALYCIIFILHLTAMPIINLVKIKTLTSKVISIIGICFSGIALLVNMIMMAGEGSFDEIGMIVIAYALIMAAFSIIHTVQAFKPNATVTPVKDDLSDIINGEDEIV